jgi:hypothetical protein
MLRSGALLRHLQCDYLHSTVNMVNIAAHRRYIPRSSSCWRVPFTFNASLRCFAPSSPILLSACHSEHGQQLTLLLIVDTYPSGLVAGAWSSLSMLRSGVLLRQLQSYSLHATVNMISGNIATHSRYIPLRFSCWSVEFTFNASLRCFPPLTPM